MLRRINQYISAQFSYYVRKTSSKQQLPLKNMTQYYLASSQSNALSFWHDIPINKNRDTVTCCIEIPREKTAKFQVNKQVPFHPIMQDTRKNFYTKEEELRYYAQFPLFNYGYIPQTWEQNVSKNQDGLYGDDDPVDVCELGQNQSSQIGDIITSRVLGSFCLIDQGEIDWKILTMELFQADTKNIATFEDLDPRLIQSVMNWFKFIKVFDGKAPNTIAFNEKIFNQRQTLDIIDETHKQWQKLLKSQEKEYVEIRRKYHIEQK